MKKALSYRFARHLLFWVGMGGFFLLIQLPDHLINGQPIFWLEYVLFELPTALLATYPLLYWLLPRLLQRRQLPLFLGLLGAWLLASVLLANLVEALAEFVIAPCLAGKPVVGTFPWSTVVDGLSRNFFVLLVIAGGATAIKVLNGWYEQQQRSQQLRQQQLHTELQLLKAQLQPTFLFQALRTLRELTARQSPAAPATVLHLSALLRYLLYDGARESAPLGEEVEMLQHYVALEKLRFGRQLDVSLNFSGAIGAHAIAPLLLLPFLENAFRHGPEASPECPWMSIDLVATQTAFTFKVIASQSETAGGEEEGAGLRAVRQRLAHLYPGRHDLKVVHEPEAEIVTLHLQLAAQPLAVPDAWAQVPTSSPLRSRP